MTRRAIVTGGAGFIGSTLVDRLLADGNEVLAVDNLSTGRLVNIVDASRHPRFTFLQADITHEETVDAMASFQIGRAHV